MIQDLWGNVGYTCLVRIQSAVPCSCQRWQWIELKADSSGQFMSQQGVVYIKCLDLIFLISRSLHLILQGQANVVEFLFWFGLFCLETSLVWFVFIILQRKIKDVKSNIEFLLRELNKCSCLLLHKKTENWNPFLFVSVNLHQPFHLLLATLHYFLPWMIQAKHHSWVKQKKRKVEPMNRKLRCSGLNV